MADMTVDYYILRTRKPPVAADRPRVEFSWPEETRMSPEGSLEVVPGVRVKVLSWGDHMVGGEVVAGALVAGQRRAEMLPCACPCSCWSQGLRDDDGTGAPLCDACRMNIHSGDRPRPRPVAVPEEADGG